MLQVLSQVKSSLHVLNQRPRMSTALAKQGFPGPFSMAQTQSLRMFTVFR